MSVFFKCDIFNGDLVVGYVGEWDLSSGDLLERKIHRSRVYCMALSGDRIVTSNSDDVIRMFNVSTCLLVLLFGY